MSYALLMQVVNVAASWEKEKIDKVYSIRNFMLLLFKSNFLHGRQVLQKKFEILVLFEKRVI